MKIENILLIVLKKVGKMIPLYKVNVTKDSVDNITNELKTVLQSGYIAEGEYVHKFEDKFAEYIGNPNVVSVNNENSALILSLFLSGVKNRTEVIASPMACVATNMPILQLNGKVIWCDVDPKTGMIVPDNIEALITERTKAILFPDWSGEVADIDRIKDVARKYNIKVIEDASESLGSEYKGKKIGNNDLDFVCFSFHAIKHITTGDGGMIAFNNNNLSEKIQWLKRYNINRKIFRDELGEINPKSDIQSFGFDFSMNNIAGVIGIEQMKTIEEKIRKHFDNGQYYIEKLKDVPGLEMLKREEHKKSSFWTFTMLSERRNDLLRYLREKEIHASKIHIRNDIYSCFACGQKIELLGVDYFSTHCISIPSGWWVTNAQREYIVETIKKGW